ncbi:hypothetical protein JCM10213_003838 [Rhodosporidiobolus nylandii]
MHLSLLLSLLAVTPAAFAAPLLAERNSNLPSTCPLQLNRTINTQIRRALEDTRAAWVPVAEGGVNVTATVTTLSSISPPDNYWSVVPLEQATATNQAVPHLVQLAANTSQCLSAAGTGGNATQVDFVCCEREAAKWSVICERCQNGFGGECEFAAWPRGTGHDSCATPNPTQGGPIELTSCEPFFNSSLPAQKFSLGVFVSE